LPKKCTGHKNQFDTKLCLFPEEEEGDNLGASTSRPMMTIAGSGRSHGATLAQAIAGGLVHNSTNVVATINCKSLVTSSSLSTQD
jgi:hypothetical protein